MRCPVAADCHRHGQNGYAKNQSVPYLTPAQALAAVGRYSFFFCHVFAVAVLCLVLCCFFSHKLSSLLYIVFVVYEYCVKYIMSSRKNELEGEIVIYYFVGGLA